MSRFVDNDSWLMPLSFVVNVLAAAAIMFLGAPPATILFAYLALIAVGSFVQDRDARRRHR